MWAIRLLSVLVIIGVGIAHFVFGYFPDLFSWVGNLPGDFSVGKSGGDIFELPLGTILASGIGGILYLCFLLR